MHVCLSCSVRFFFTRSISLSNKKRTKKKNCTNRLFFFRCCSRLHHRAILHGRILLRYGSTLPCVQDVRVEKWINKLSESFVLRFAQHSAGFLLYCFLCTIIFFSRSLFLSFVRASFSNKFPQLTHVMCATAFVDIYGFSRAKKWSVRASKRTRL